MRLRRKFAIGVGMLLTDVVLLCCALYLPVIIRRAEHVQVQPVLWFLIATITFGINLVLVRGRRKVGVFFAINVVLMAAACICNLLTLQGSLMALPFHIFSCGILCVIIGHGLYLAVAAPKVEHAILFVDAQVVVVGIFLAGCQLRQLEHVLLLQVFAFAAVGYMLVALVFLRTSQVGIRIVQGAGSRSRAGIFGGLAVIVAGSVSLSIGFQAKASGMVSNIWQVFVWLGGQTKSGLGSLGERLRAFFLQFVHVDEAESVALEATHQAPLGEGEEWILMFALPTWFPVFLLVLALAIAAFFVIRGILRLRKEQIGEERILTSDVQTEVVQQTAETPGIFTRIRARLAYRRKKRSLRYTIVGLVGKMEQLGQAKKLPMLAGESWHGYVRRVAQEKDEHGLLELADLLEAYFYGGAERSFSREEYQRYISLFEKGLQ